MPQSPQRLVTLFALFNLIAVPLVGRAVWQGMAALNDQGAIFAAVALSVAAALAILAVNAALAVMATRAGASDLARTVVWAVTGLTFVLTIGTGFFSPLTLLYALVTG